MAWRDLIPYRRDPGRRAGADVDELLQFADTMGYTLQRSPDGKLIPIPKDIASEDIPALQSNWGAIYNESFHSFENREKRIKSYKMMDGSGGIGSVVLDTYADEIVNVVDNTEQSLQLEFSDKDIGKKVVECLTANGVLSSVRQDIRSLCKFGDAAYLIAPRRGTELVKITEAQAKDGVAIDNPLRPSDIVLHFMQSSDYELAGYHNRIYKLRVERDVIGGFKYDMDEYDPWMFSPFVVQDRDTFPYGLSIIEKMRVPWEQLQIMEKLLAVARANSVDRIGIRVPGMGTDVGSMMAKLSQLRNSLKTILQLGANSRMTRNQDIGITEYLFVPDSFKLEKLSTSISLSNPEDVTYFRDAVQNASRLPKGFFIAENDNGQARPMSLRQRDLKFARSLIPISEAYCNGVRHLSMLLAFYMGGDVSKLEVKVALKKSPYISGDLVQMYKDVISMVDAHVSIKKAIDPEYKITDSDIRTLLDMIGAPTTVIFPKDAPSNWAGNSSQPSSLYEACCSNRVLGTGNEQAAPEPDYAEQSKRDSKPRSRLAGLYGNSV